MITVAEESPLTDDGRALIAASDAAMRAAFPPEECFTLDPEELVAEGAHFFVARRDGRPLGCVALVEKPGYGEVKRLLVLPEARGLGVGRILMQHLEDEARRLGLRRIRLETGHALKAAVGLYTSLGYVPCPPFGGYPDIPGNLFLEKRL